MSEAISDCIVSTVSPTVLTRCEEIISPEFTTVTV